MSSIEERLARDIAAVAGGVVVTDSDLWDARAAVDERIESKRRRDRRRTVVAAAAAAVVVGVVGVTAFQTLGEDAKTAPPAGDPEPTLSDADAAYLSGDAPTPQLIAGVWRVDNGVVLLRFGADGTVRFTDHGTLFSDPATIGTYEIDGDLITVTTTEDARSECIGTEFAMHASLPEPGALRFVSSPATSGACTAMPAGHQVLEQVLPTSQSMSEAVFSTERGWQPVSDEVTLHGDWQAEGGGYVLEMAANGSYYVADESAEPIDRGEWSLRGSDLTLTSSASSAECSAGDQLVLAAVQYVDPGTTAIRGTVRKNTCGGAWTPAAWFLIPQVGTM